MSILLFPGADLRLRIALTLIERLRPGCADDAAALVRTAAPIADWIESGLLPVDRGDDLAHKVERIGSVASPADSHGLVFDIGNTEHEGEDKPLAGERSVVHNESPDDGSATPSVDARAGVGNDPGASAMPSRGKDA